MKKILSLLVLAAAAHAYEGVEGDPHASHGQGAHAHLNHVALFGGATYHHSHFYQTAGLDYERLLNPKLGLTGMAEVVFADHAAFIGGAGLAWHPVPALKLAAIPAIEYGDGHSAFLMRGTVEYAFHAGPLSVAPSFSVDYVSSEVALVPGIAVGAGF
jgi:hypothetical protein